MSRLSENLEMVHKFEGIIRYLQLDPEMFPDLNEITAEQRTQVIEALSKLSTKFAGNARSIMLAQTEKQAK